MTEKFARAYVAQTSGHNFTDLKDICEDISFVTSGYDGESTLLAVVVEGLRNFSPRRDVIVPVGNVYINLLVGMVAAHMSKDWGYFRVALYREKTYHIQIVDVRNVGELLDAFKQAQS